MTGTSTGTESADRRPNRLAAAMGDISGAFGDLGTMLPYVIAGLMAGLLAPAPVFAGFAAGYALVAFRYRIPIPVQPMKAMGAALLAGHLAPTELAIAGALMGVILLAMSALPGLVTHARAIPQSVIVGLQVGLGITLFLVALDLMDQNWWLAAPALAVLGLSLVWTRGPWALLVIGAALAFGLVTGLTTTLPAPGPPETAISASDIVLFGLLPQLPLTLLNAVVLTAALARSVYGPDAARVTEARLAASSGALTLIFAPLGGLPMCHGAGGVTAHHRFGARGMLAPLLLAGLCATMALAGPSVLGLLGAIPMPVVGALLAYAAADLAFSRRLLDARADCRPVMAAAALGTAILGPAVGLAAGLAAETLRKARATGATRP